MYAYEGHCHLSLIYRYVIKKPSQWHRLGGDRVHEIALASLMQRDPPPVLCPLYAVERKDTASGEYTFMPRNASGVTPTYAAYFKHQLVRDAKECVCRCAITEPTAEAPLDQSCWDYEMPNQSVSYYESKHHSKRDCKTHDTRLLCVMSMIADAMCLTLYVLHPGTQPWMGTFSSARALLQSIDNCQIPSTLGQR